MKRATIRMITFHSPKNYGAVLQAFSLMSFLQDAGYDVKVIDFNTPHLRALYPLVPRPKTLREAVKTIITLPVLPAKRKKYAKFERFVNEKLNLTARYDSFELLESNPPQADYYFTGSDQVFKPTRIEEERKAFFLDFGDDHVKKISYAGSFGMKEVPKEKECEIANLLKRFYKLSVRESSGVEIVRSLTGRSAQEVLDPVFLNDQEFWRNIEKSYSGISGEYLLYYRLMTSPDSDAVARKVAKDKNLPLVVITEGSIKRNTGKIFRDVGPEEFLYLFDKAQYVVTDSFHGVAFSLIFRKQFIFTECKQNLAERGLNLMEKLHVSHCATLNGNRGERVINYTAVDEELQKLISKSKGFIFEALS